MKKSKTISLFNCLTILLLIFAILNVILNYNKIPISKYHNQKIITGNITKCTAKDDSYQIIINGKEKVLINYNHSFNCKLGIKIKAYGKLQLPKSNNIFNLFDYQKYLLSEKIIYTFKADKIKVLNRQVNYLYKIKNSLKDYINTYKSKDYLNAFILGDSKNIEREVRDSYQINGLSHLLAVSGMHITVLATIILFILNKISKKEKRHYIILILCLIFYMFLTNFTPSVVRASLMFIILTIKKVFNLKISSISVFLLVLALYLLDNPYMIYHLGFIYSFTITFYLILFNKLIINIKGYFKKILMISFIAFLAGMPITINNFFSINLVSILLNTIFVPLVSLVIYPMNLLVLLFKPLDNLLQVFVSFMENLSLIFSHFDISIILKHMNLLVFIIYYLLITYALYKLSKKQKRGLVILIITLIIHNNINYFDRASSMTMIDIGQGDSILLKLEHNKGNILIDTGGVISYDDKKPYDLATNKIIPYLKSEGIKKLDYLILTHGDFDHAGMAINLLKNFQINQVLFNSNHDNKLENQIIKYLNNHQQKYTHIKDEKIKIGNIYLQFLDSQKTDNENDDSLIIYTKIKNTSILLMGDASTKREKYILNKYELPKIDILKVGHHGSATSSSKSFINQITPKYSLISVGKNNIYGHPHSKTLKILKSSEILRTDLNGSIKIEIYGQKRKIKLCH